MQLIQAILLGVIQGLTEFLPVSSSGHLVLLQNIFGLTEPEVLFDISLHIGTLTAVCIVFFSEILSILKTLFNLPGLLKTSGGIKQLYQDNEPVRMATLIVIGSIPTAVLGLLLHKMVDQLFGSVRIVGLMLIITGAILWQTRRFRIKGRPLTGTTIKHALVIGLVQGVAIMPGISRSGSTISAALFMGIDREVAGRFSFLLSIPAILGALVLSIDSPAMETTVSGGMFLMGTLTAGIVGFGALKVLLHIVNRGRLHFFAPYCWLLGIVALIVGS
ncbi:MAG: undecaprenyl-diphosphate phosphatase [Desulfobacterales bacterium]|nr:undecaprenyl-diphosphate phosphatase [Desulfobacterales bacterium]